MLISLVTGTYNRIAFLQRMIDSARRQIPRHIPYQVIVVDGGSTDGTLEWCEAQADIKLIRHGELRGAIRAFCDGAAAAQGDYVIMANDDVEFHPYSIMSAVSYLESHRHCGAVAFADNRTSQMQAGFEGYQVLGMPAIGLDGKPTGVTYAQVGMFRRWLGDLAGWWGANDPIMGKARTYGGDNYLSSRIWEMGYSVDAVEGCTVDDLIPRDNLREINTSKGAQDSAQYYARFPHGPQLKPVPTISHPGDHERLRVVVMDIHESTIPARQAKEQGLAEAFARACLTWHVDYMNEEWDLPAIVRAWQPHVLFTQMHDTNRINAGVLSRARAEKPDMVIVNWNGDASEKGLVTPDILEALREVDLQTVVNAAVLPVYEREGIPAAYWQIGIKYPAAPYAGDVPQYEVLWQGNCYNEERKALLNAIRSVRINKRKPKLGVFGSCAGSDGNTHYDFAHQAALYGSALITVGDTFPNTVGFVSNRLFQALSAGAFMLQQHSPRLDELTGLKAGVHYVEWKTLDDLKRLIVEWLQPECAEDRQRIAQAGRAFVEEHFTYDAQVRKLWTLLP